MMAVGYIGQGTAHLDTVGCLVMLAVGYIGQGTAHSDTVGCPVMLAVGYIGQGTAHSDTVGCPVMLEVGYICRGTFRLQACSINVACQTLRGDVWSNQLVISDNTPHTTPHHTSTEQQCWKSLSTVPCGLSSVHEWEFLVLLPPCIIIIYGPTGMYCLRPLCLSYL
jgi:hypothetical protein